MCTPETPESMVEEYPKLKRAYDLLKKIWIDADSYPHEIPEKLWRKMNDFFELDDSE